MNLALRIGIVFLFSAPLAQAAAPAWVVRSDALTQPVLQDSARYVPEQASALGQEQYDTAVADLNPGLYERQLADTQKRLAALRLLRAAEADVKVRQDLDILINSRVDLIATMQLRHQYLLDYTDAGQLVYFGLSTLLDARNKPARQAAALARLKRYVGGSGGTPLTVLARARAEEELARPGLIGPYIEEVEQALKNSPTYLSGIADLFKKDGLTGWEADLATLAAQVNDYNAWLRGHVLPRARKTVQLPPALYADKLKNVGVEMAPEQLITQASFDFQEVRGQMQALANDIAARRHLPSSNYRDVIRALKQQQIAPDAVLGAYRARLKDIEAIIRREDLVTLPNRAANIRLATDAESAQVSAPFMNPPRLIGNTGDYGEFVIPLRNPNAKSAAAMDDFNHDAMEWTVAAHEARPGHELQFASMVEQGVSLARVTFAFNSANVEGWGLYSEALMLPYMPPEGQLMSLDLRLMRMARAFLDPLINLGRITPAEAKQFLMREVLLSEPFAQSEVDRYAYKMPGQATSYYYGYVQLLALRTQLELLLGDKFRLKAFNDFVIAQGLLPPPLLKQALMDDFLPAQLARK